MSYEQHQGEQYSGLGREPYAEYVEQQQLQPMALAVRPGGEKLVVHKRNLLGELAQKAVERTIDPVRSTAHALRTQHNIRKVAFNALRVCTGERDAILGRYIRQIATGPGIRSTDVLSGLEAGVRALATGPHAEVFHEDGVYCRSSFADGFIGVVNTVVFMMGSKNGGVMTGICFDGYGTKGVTGILSTTSYRKGVWHNHSVRNGLVVHVADEEKLRARFDSALRLNCQKGLEDWENSTPNIFEAYYRGPIGRPYSDGYSGDC